MEAYVRFAALVAVIVRIVRRRDRKRAKISSFLTRVQKKLERNYQSSGIGSGAGGQWILWMLWNR